MPGFPAADDPLELGKATLYLPTRRACRLAREVFLDELKGDAAILPRIVALGDLDEDEIAFAEAATGELAEAALALPPAFGGLERRLTLAKLISAWAAAIAPGQGAPLIANTPAAVLALADALARLMDDMTTRQVPWDNLDKLVPEDLDEYWKQSLDFLKFVHPRWRKFLKSRTPSSPAERRDKLIEAEAKRLANSSRAGDRRRFHRLDAGDRQIARDHRQPAAWRAGAARPRHGSRRRHLGADCGQRRR